MDDNEYKKKVMRVGITTIIWNAILSIGKIIVGIISGAASLVSDGFHSMSDVFSTFIVMIGAKISTKKEDNDHPFGHERFESIASIILSFLLFDTAAILGYKGILSIIDYTNGILPEKTKFIYVALVCAILSIVIKFFMYVYTKRAARQINSTALKADAYHHLSDSLSSFGSLIGIIGMIIGGYYSIFDPIASIIIALFIIYVSIDILRESINQLVDKSAPKETEDNMRKLIMSCDNVLDISSLKTRVFGNRLYVEVEIVVDGNMSVIQGHDIAHNVHDLIEEKYSNVKHCMVHVDPKI